MAMDNGLLYAKIEAPENKRRDDEPDTLAYCV
jgi:hypothetical protein